MESTIVWIRFILVMVVPCLLGATYLLPALLITYRSRVLILSGVSAIVVILAIQGMLPKSIPNDAFLFTLPMLDAGIFIASRSLFQFLTGRYPLEYGAIFRKTSSRYGESYLLDHVFWLSNILMGVFVGFAICASFKLNFPTKSGMTNFN